MAVHVCTRESKLERLISFLLLMKSSTNCLFCCWIVPLLKKNRMVCSNKWMWSVCKTNKFITQRENIKTTFCVQQNSINCKPGLWNSEDGREGNVGVQSRHRLS